MGHIQIWHHIFLYQKLLKHFNDFQNQNFSVLEPKQWNKNKIRHFFVEHIQIILKYFNDFYNWNFSILFVKVNTMK